MQLDHSFTVPVGIDEAWKVLLDIERVAARLPGAALDSVVGDDFTGSMKVKLGPISLTYKGKASFVEKDEAARQVRIDAHGKDSRGGGTARAVVTATLAAVGDTTTRVDLSTDLTITGKPAQVGHDVVVEVSANLIGQFADNLAGELGGGLPAASSEARPEPLTAATPAQTPPPIPTPPAAPVPPAAPMPPAPSAAKKAAPAKKAPAKALAEPATEPATEPAAEPPSKDVEPIDLLATARPAVAKRTIALAVALVVLIAIVLGWRRRR